MSGGIAYVLTEKEETTDAPVLPTPPSTLPKMTEHTPPIVVPTSEIQPLEDLTTMQSTPHTETRIPAYDSVVLFSKNTPLVFPHFTVTFTGTTDVKPDAAPQLTFTYYHFTIKSHDGRTRTLSWSSGTGVIAPKPFVVENQLYALELKFVEKTSQQLADSELVISPVETDYFGEKVGVGSYLFPLIAQLTPLTTQTIESISAILGFTFVSKPLAALMVSIYESDGFGPITHAELRTHRMDSGKKLLILTIDPGANIPKTNIVSKYPDATDAASPYAHEATALSMPGVFGYNEVWGTIIFGFDTEDRLTSIVINSLD